MKSFRLVFPSAVLIAASLTASGHVPYLEEEDYTIQRPFLDLDVEQSIAVYAWLESGNDVDVYVCWVPGPVRLFAELLVPVCPSLESFFPAIAVLGPGLPAPALPVGGGYGLLPVPWVDRDEPREQFYEPFGNKSYYQGPSYDTEVSVPGLYFIFCWDPEGTGGDYVLPIGYEERWPLNAILRALQITPKIRRNEELHGPCAD